MNARYSSPDFLDVLKSGIADLLKIRSSMYIHRKRFSVLCGFLDNFRVTVMQIDFSGRVLTEFETEQLHNLILSIEKLKTYFQQFSRDNFVASISEHSIASTNEFIQNFVSSFNEYVRALKLCEFDPIPSFDLQSEIISLSSDIQDIIEKIESVGGESSILKQRLDELIDLRETIKTRQKYQRDHEDNQRRLMPQSEIEEILKPYSQWFMKHTDFKQQRRIGSGAYADVYSGYQKSTNRIVAIKRLHAQKFSVSDFELFRREIEILSQMRHFAVLTFVGVCISPPYLIITEFMSGGSLFDWLRQPVPRLDPTKLTIIALGVACGMTYLHSRQLLHRDIKSMNILLDPDGFPKICDFGMSRWVSHDDNTLTVGVGTSQWMAPEVLNLQPYNYKADVYSYGILLWEMLSRDIPFRGMKDIQVAMAVVHHDYRLLMPYDAPPRLAKLIERCWHKDPNVRPDFPTIVSAFSSGGIEFPGTNRDAVIAYMSSQMPVDFLSVESASISSILDDIRKKPEDLIDRMNKCDNRQLAEEILQYTADVLKDDEQFNNFKDWNGPDGILKLIMKFGTASMTAIIDCLRVMTRVKVVSFEEQHFSKIAAFVIAANMETRISTIVLITQIVETEAYMDPRDLNIIVPNLLANAFPGAVPELVIKTLELINLLVEFEEIKKEPILDSVLVLLTGLVMNEKANDTVCRSCLKVLKSVLVQLKPESKTITAFLKLFVKLVDSGHVVDTLRILGLLTNAQFSDIPLREVSQKLRELLSCGDTTVLIYTLKLIYIFVTNATTRAYFGDFADEISAFMDDENASVAALAAVVINVYIQQSGGLIQPERIIEFIRKRISTGELGAVALKLAGTMSSLLEGAIKLEQENVYTDIARKLESENSKEKELAAMVFAAASYNYPLSKSMTKVIPFFLENVSSDLCEYCLIFLANIAVNTSGALACAVHIEKVLRVVKKCGSEDQFRILTLLKRLVSVEEAREIFDEHIIESIVVATKEFWSSRHSKIVFKIYTSLASSELGRKLILASGYREFAMTKLETFNKSQQTLIMRTLSLLS